MSRGTNHPHNHGSEEGNQHDEPLQALYPQDFTTPEKQEARARREALIRRYIMAIDKLETSALVYLLRICGINEKALKTIERKKIDGTFWAALFSRRFDANTTALRSNST